MDYEDYEEIDEPDMAALFQATGEKIRVVCSDAIELAERRGVDPALCVFNALAQEMALLVTASSSFSKKDAVGILKCHIKRSVEVNNSPSPQKKKMAAQIIPFPTKVG